MFVLEDLKDRKKETLEKILSEYGREGVLSFCAGVLDKRAYFTVDMNGNIKRKKMNYAVCAAVSVQEDSIFTNYVAENLDFAEKIKIEKIERMNNVENIEKNIFKLLAKGDFHFTGKYCKELYMRNNDEFFKMMFQFALMDNMSFEKSLAVYSMKKYFEKFGYSDEVLYLTISYMAKMRADFSEYESIQIEKNVSKNELREKIKNNIEKYKNQEGMCILGYLLGLLSYNYENEEKFTAVLCRKTEQFEKSDVKKEQLSNIQVQIFEYLSKEV